MKLANSWNTRIVAQTTQGKEISPTIRFKKGLPQGDALYSMLFILCLNPTAWKVRATEGYRLSKPISTKITDEKCRLCGDSLENVQHILSGCGALAQTKYQQRQKRFQDLIL